MNTLRYLAILGLCLAPLASAQDAEPFDPYKAYKAGEVETPDPVENAQDAAEPFSTLPAQPDNEVIEAPTTQSMTEAELDAWIAQTEKEALQQIERDAAAATPAKEIETRDTGGAPPVDAPLTSLDTPPPASVDVGPNSDIRPSTEMPLPQSPKEKIQIDTLSETDVLTGGQIAPQDDSLAVEPITIIPTDDIDLEITQSDAQAPTDTGVKPVLADLPAAPFYLTAKEYRQYRGDAKQPQLILQYDVTSVKLDSSNIQISSKATLILGEDFAAISNSTPGKPETLRIYDFKLNRLLNLTPNQKSLSFSNSSLYANAHRNTRLVGMMTDNGKRGDIDFGKGLTLPAFWLESTMSFSAVDRIEDIAISKEASTISASFGDETVAQITLSDTPFEVAGMSNTQLVFAHHYWPVHPTILRQIFEAPGPVESLSYISRGPDDPKGTKYTWTLSARKDVTKDFPLPVLAEGITDRADAPPLAASLRQTLTAPAPDFTTIRAPFLNAETPLEAWHNGQRYVTYSGHCAKKNRPQLCNDITDIAADPDLAQSFAPIAQAANLSQTKAGRASALPVLAKAANAEDASAAVLYLAGMTRARLKAADLSPDMQAFDAEAALTRAINADPHNPSYLMGLAQYYAANDRFEEAWDLYDTLRVVLAQPSMEGHNIRVPIARVENGLSELSPAYFLPK